MSEVIDVEETIHLVHGRRLQVFALFFLLAARRFISAELSSWSQSLVPLSFTPKTVLGANAQPLF